MKLDGPGPRVLLAVTTVLTGLLAGLYFCFAVAVVPGLGGTADAVFAPAMNQINVAIQNPVFFVAFLGAPLLSVVAIVVARRGPRARQGWLIAAAALNVVSIALTVGANLPLNDALARTSDIAAFESTWVMWNAIRTVATIGAFVGMVGALMARPGRTRAGGT